MNLRFLFPGALVALLSCSHNDVPQPQPQPAAPPAGTLLQLRSVFGGAAVSAGFVYDAQNRLARINYFDGDTLPATPGPRDFYQEFAYTGNGTLPVSASTHSSLQQTDYLSYDAQGRAVRDSVATPSGFCYLVTLQYSGNTVLRELYSRQSPTSARTHLATDSLYFQNGNLVRAVRSDHSLGSVNERRNSFDAAANPLHGTNIAPALLAMETYPGDVEPTNYRFTHGYNANNMVHSDRAYSANGATANFDDLYLTYDAAGRPATRRWVYTASGVMVMDTLTYRYQ